MDGKFYFEPGIIVHTVGGGLGQLLRWREIALQLDVDLRYRSRVTKFVGDFRGIDGVCVATDDDDYELNAGAVIVCAGGFQANAEMRARYLGANADLMKVRGSKHNTGEILRALLDLGVKPAGHWQGAHATPIDAMLRMAARHCVRMATATPAIAMTTRRALPSIISPNVFMMKERTTTLIPTPKPDAPSWRSPAAWHIRYTTRKVSSCFRLGAEYTDVYEEADTIAELAAKIRIEPVALEATIAEFNAAVQTDIPFNPGILDGRSTKDLVLPKSNWANPIDEPPFRAYTVTGGCDLLVWRCAYQYQL